MDCSTSLVPFDVKGAINTSKDLILEHVKTNVRRQLPQLKVYQPSSEEIILALGGPSLRENIEDLKAQVKAGLKVVSVNGTHDYLISHGIKPSVHIMIDARPTNSRFVQNAIDGCRYFISSQCHPSVFDTLRDKQVYIFHADSHEEVTEFLKSYYFERFHIVEGGSTVGSRSLMLLRMLGFSRMHVYGFDSCLIGDKHHAYEQKENDGDQTIKIVTKPNEREFVCAAWMAKQAQEFQDIVQHRGDLFELNVIGDGLIAHIIKTGSRLENQDGSERQNPGDQGNDCPARKEDQGQAPQHGGGQGAPQGYEARS